MKKKNLLLGTASAVGALGASAFAFSDNCLKTSEYCLNTGKLEKTVRFAALSDLHFSKFGKDNIRLVNAVRKVNPDGIILAGDFFDIHDGKSNKDLIVTTLKQLCTVSTVYFTPGNHDVRYDVITGETCLDYAEDAGCVVLDGNYIDAEIKGQTIRIGGVYDSGCHLEDYGRAWKKSPVYSFLNDFQQTQSVKIVAIHRPNTFMYTYGYTDTDWDIDGVISGHDHGGVWRFPFIGGIYAADQGLFPKYDKGIYEFGKVKMFLSTGLEGYYRIPRLFNRPEIIVLDVN